MPIVALLAFQNIAATMKFQSLTWVYAYCSRGLVFAVELCIQFQSLTWVYTYCSSGPGERCAISGKVSIPHLGLYLL